jgi:hypothetical protein
MTGKKGRILLEAFKLSTFVFVPIGLMTYVMKSDGLAWFMEQKAYVTYPPEDPNRPELLEKARKEMNIKKAAKEAREREEQAKGGGGV